MKQKYYGLSTKVSRIGITSRTETANSYYEVRDCLAQDWSHFMYSFCPTVCWVSLPNIGRAIVDYVLQWQLDGFIFSGGNDIGDNLRRDLTEQTLLNFAISKNLPVFGVCRGLQLFQQYFGGLLSPCPDKSHVAKEHTITLESSSLNVGFPLELVVNSYHSWGVRLGDLAPSLEVLARSGDGFVEAIHHPKKPIIAVQWHPERKATKQQTALDYHLLSSILRV